MNLFTSALVVLVTLAVIAWLVIRPERINRPGRLVPRQRRLVIRALPWWQKLDGRRRARLLGQVARLQQDITLVSGDGFTPDESQRMAVLGHIAIASLAPDINPHWLPDEIVIYGGPIDASETALPHDMIEDLGELATGESWASERLAVSWPQVARAARGSGPENPLIRGLAAWRMRQLMVDSDRHASWIAAYQAVYDRWARDPRGPTRQLLRQIEPGGDPDTELPRFVGAAAEAFFQRGPELARILPGVYDLMATGFDFDTARRAPAGHRTPRVTPE